MKAALLPHLRCHTISNKHNHGNHDNGVDSNRNRNNNTINDEEMLLMRMRLLIQMVGIYNMFSLKKTF